MISEVQLQFEYGTDLPEHAPYSPSSSDRWMACPGSVGLTAELHSTTSEHNEFTASGTVVHAIGEQILRAELLHNESADGILDNAITETWGYYADVDEFNAYAVTEEMVTQARDYLRHVKSLVRDDDLIGIETRLELDSKLYGTADLVLVGDKRLLIGDLKSGSGLLVSPVENAQLLTYASMALLNLAVEPEEVHLCIIQPPDDIQLKLWVTDVATVRAHAEKVLLAMGGNELVAGKHCKWCPCRASCPQLTAVAKSAMQVDLDGLSGEGWAEALQMAEILKPWCKSVEDRAHQLAAEAGLKIPGMKIVQKFGYKKWKSEKEAAYKLSEVLSLDAPNIFNDAKLRTPTQLKSELKAFIDGDIIDSLITVPVRGTALVAESDKRPAIQTTDHGKIAESLSAFVNSNNQK